MLTLKKAPLWVVFFLSGISVTLSIYFEYFENIAPCRLCIIQRTIHGILIAVSTMGVFYRFKNLSIKICQGLLGISFLVASYHSLIQMGVLKDRCNTALEFNDIASFKTLLTNPPLPCSKTPIQFLNIPIQILNACLSLLVFSFLILSQKSTARRNGSDPTAFAKPRKQPTSYTP